MSSAPNTGRHAVVEHPGTRLHGHRKLWLITGLVLIAIAAFYAIVFTIYWPFKKQELINVLQERSQRSVTVDSFRTSYFPPGGVAEGIKFWRYRHKNEQLLITIEKIEVSVTFPTLLTFQHHLDELRVIGLHLMVPAHEPPGDPSPMLLLTTTTSKQSLPVEHLEARNAILDYFIGSNPQPVRITVSKLLASHLSSTTAMPYSIDVSNSEVPGSIHSEGTLGPPDLKQPAGTPIRGRFSCQGANLAPVPGIQGKVFANATYSGRLGDIAVHGAAHIQNFAVKDTSHARDVSGTYSFTVNAIDGDVRLQQVNTAFDQSKVSFTGLISGGNHNNGQVAAIDISSQDARLQDILDLFISSKQSPMTGDVTLNGHFTLPIGFQAFVHDMTLTGRFGIVKGKFTSAPTEESLSKLSQTSEAAKHEESQTSLATVLPDLSGDADVKQGIAHLSHVEFRIPGARARVSGTYGLLTYQANLAGTLVTTGNISDTESGIKSLFLKALTPFFKHREKAKIIPIKITGPYGHTSVTLDLGRKTRKISS